MGIVSQIRVIRLQFGLVCSTASKTALNLCRFFFFFAEGFHEMNSITFFSSTAFDEEVTGVTGTRSH